MHYREIPRLQVRFSEVSLGCNRLGDRQESDRHWIELVYRALERGVNLFDTAQSYADGRSEEMLGRALGDRDDVYLSTKMKWGPDPHRRFSAERVVRSVEESLRRLRRSRIDLYQLHSPNRDELEHCDWADGMARLREQGKIRWLAMSSDILADSIWLLRQDLVDFLQITYNVLDIAAEEELFALAEERRVGLLCRLPLAQGVLTGKFRSGREVPDDHRVQHSGPERIRERVALAETLRPLASEYPGGMTRLALHFSLTPPSITAIIPGARTIEQLKENVAASNGRGLGEDWRRRIEELRLRWGEWVGGYWQAEAS